MDRDLNHDEHQFLAPGALLSREGLLPYRDYPLFHLPNLVFLYAAGDRLTGSPILSAKLISFTSSAGMLAILAWYGLGVDATRRRVAIFSGIALPLLLFFDPVFYYTAGKTWNHEVPSFLIVASILLQAFAVRNRSLRVAALSGLAGGLAVGTRLTFAPILLPLCLGALLYPGNWRQRTYLILATGLGTGIGLLPSFVMFVKAPDNFLFGNFEFPRLRLLDPENTRIQKTMRLSAKLRYFFKDVVLPSLPLYAAYLAIGVRPAWRWLQRKEFGSLTASLILACLPFALAGCFAPSRYQYQHYFGVNCMVALGVAAGVRPMWEILRGKTPSFLPAILATASCAAVVMAVTAKDKRQRFELNIEARGNWFHQKARRVGEEVKQHVGVGPILTLAPAWVLEAELPIYPEFASGPFAWRSAPFASKKRRESSHLIAPVDLDDLLERRPPGAILTGVEDKELEKPFIEYAKRHGFEKVELSKDRELWLPR